MTFLRALIAASTGPLPDDAASNF
jgi:hypothetical protein